MIARLRRFARDAAALEDAVRPGGGLDGIGRHAAPNYDTDRPAQIRCVFEMAREFDVDIDMHLDSSASAEELAPVVTLLSGSCRRTTEEQSP